MSNSGYPLFQLQLRGLYSKLPAGGRGGGGVDFEILDHREKEKQVQRILEFINVRLEPVTERQEEEEEESIRNLNHEEKEKRETTARTRHAGTGAHMRPDTHDLCFARSEGTRDLVADIVCYT